MPDLLGNLLLVPGDPTPGLPSSDFCTMGSKLLPAGLAGLPSLPFWTGIFGGLDGRLGFGLIWSLWSAVSVSSTISGEGVILPLVRSGSLVDGDSRPGNPLVTFFGVASPDCLLVGVAGLPGILRGFASFDADGLLDLFLSGVGMPLTFS